MLPVLLSSVSDVKQLSVTVGHYVEIASRPSALTAHDGVTHVTDTVRTLPYHMVVVVLGAV